jgi:maltooligosyltrehalose trehalohydrolase
MLRAMTALTLLGPQTPMLFMGQEIGAIEPFPFFADQNSELAPLVRDGRREFLKQFRTYASDAVQASIPDPADPKTFESAKLDVGEHRMDTPAFRLHRDLLSLRRSEPSIRAQSRQHIDGAVLSDRAFVLRWLGPGRELLLVVNLGGQRFEIVGSEPLLACAADESWSVLWSSEHPDYGGSGILSPVDESGWSLPTTSATLLAAVADGDSRARTFESTRSRAARLPCARAPDRRAARG